MLLKRQLKRSLTSVTRLLRVREHPGLPNPWSDALILMSPLLFLGELSQTQCPEYSCWQNYFQVSCGHCIWKAARDSPAICRFQWLWAPEFPSSGAHSTSGQRLEPSIVLLSLLLTEIHVVSSPHDHRVQGGDSQTLLGGMYPHLPA